MKFDTMNRQVMSNMMQEHSSSRERTCMENHGEAASWFISPGTIFGGIGTNNMLRTYEEQQQPIRFDAPAGGVFSPGANPVRRPNDYFEAVSFPPRTTITATYPLGNNIQNTPGAHVETCGPMDILAGRIGKPKEEILGKGHPGTRIFDETIAQNLQTYQEYEGRRKSRSSLIKNVMDGLLARGCRFLKFHAKVGCFIVLDEKQIRDKVSFAFRHQSAKAAQDVTTRTRKRKRKDTSNAAMQTVDNKESKNCEGDANARFPGSFDGAASARIGNPDPSFWKPSEVSFLSSASTTALPANNDFFVSDENLQRLKVSTMCAPACPEEDDDSEIEFLEKIEELDVDDLSLEVEDDGSMFGTIDDEGLLGIPFLCCKSLMQSKK